MNRNQKYEILQGSTRRLKQYGDQTVYRVRALKDFSDVKAGDLGGWVHSEANLSQEGLCWVYDESIVFDQARVQGDAKICNHSVVANYAKVFDSAVLEDGRTCGNAIVFENAIIRKAVISEDASIFGRACIDNACIGGKTSVYGEAQVSNISLFYNFAEVCGNMIIRSTQDFLFLSPIGRINLFFAVNQNNAILVKARSYLGTLEDFQDKITKNFWMKQNQKEIEAAIALAKVHIEN